jgi:hypothetical protein
MGQGAVCVVFNGRAERASPQVGRLRNQTRPGRSDPHIEDASERFGRRDIGTVGAERSCLDDGSNRVPFWRGFHPVGPKRSTRMRSTGTPMLVTASVAASAKGDDPQM